MQTIDTVNPLILFLRYRTQCINVARRRPRARVEKPHLHRIDGGHTAALLALISSQPVLLAGARRDDRRCLLL